MKDFTFIFLSAGHYRIIYTSPKTGKQWASLCTDMGIIDEMRNNSEVTARQIELLRYWVKGIPQTESIY